MSQLRVISVEKLRPDPDVQDPATFSVARARKIGRNWDDAACGVLDASPANGSDMFDVWIGRHRLAGAKIAGVRELRVDVHPGLSVQDKFRIKLAKDRDRRSVRKVELFLNAVGAGEPAAVAIHKLVTERGWRITLSASRAPDVIVAVGALEQLYARGILATVLDLNKTWFEEPQTNIGLWLSGLGGFVSEAPELTAEQRSRLELVVPAKVVRTAISKTTSIHSPTHGNTETTWLVADELRKITGVPRRKRKDGK